MAVGTRRAWILAAFPLAARGASIGAAVALGLVAGMGPGSARASEILLALHGRWQGSGVDILIDTERMQGNVDPQKPFTRNPLVIRDVTPPWVVFAIGISTFVARIEGETMTITQPGWPAPRMVSRLPESRRPPLAQAGNP